MKSTLWLLVLVLVTVLLPGCYAVTKSSSYYGVKTAGQNVVFLLDISGSMEDKDEGTPGSQVTQKVVDWAADKTSSAIGGFLGNLVSKQIESQTTKLGSAKRALIPAIRGLDASSRYTVVTFGDTVDAWHDQLISATIVSKNTDIFRVNGLSANGGTPMLAALEHAFGYLDVTISFLLTDGQPTDSSNTQILERVRALNKDRHVVIYTIDFGKDDDFLRRLATENGGKYVDQTYAGQLFPF